MKKQINLYQPSCYPKGEKATFSQFSVLLLVCICLSVLSYFVVSHQSKSLAGRLLAQQNSVSEQQIKLSDLVVELQQKRAPEDKLRLHSALQDEVKAKQRLLASIAGMDIAELVSFSELMFGISHAYLPDLSITHFSMVSGVLNISGQAKHSNSVPLWLSNVQVTKELSAVAFKSISIKEEKGFFTFELTNSDLKGKRK